MDKRISMLNKEGNKSAGEPMADLEEISLRLERIEDLLQSLRAPTQQKYFYTTSEAAERLGLSAWYVRRLCSVGENFLATASLSFDVENNVESKTFLEVSDGKSSASD